MYCIQVQKCNSITDSHQHLHTHTFTKLTQVYIQPIRAYLEQIYTSTMLESCLILTY